MKKQILFWYLRSFFLSRLFWLLWLVQRRRRRPSFLTVLSTELWRVSALMEVKFDFQVLVSSQSCHISPEQKQQSRTQISGSFTSKKEKRAPMGWEQLQCINPRPGLYSWVLSFHTGPRTMCRRPQQRSPLPAAGIWDPVLSVMIDTSWSQVE